MPDTRESGENFDAACKFNVNSQCTTGPWEFDPNSTVNNDGGVPIRGNVTDDGFELVATVVLKADAARGKGWMFAIGEDEERDANARLIAASPTLLEAAAASIEAIRQGEPDIALIYLRQAVNQAVEGKAEGSG